MKTKIMGILNVTPDSFSDGGEYNTPEKAVKRAKEMLLEGADYIDIGGESTRRFSPFDYNTSQTVEAEEELARVLPVIKRIKKELPETRLSIDTWKASVAKEVLSEGVHAINSLGGFLFDKELASVASHYNCMIIIYHIHDKQNKNDSDIIQQIYTFFEEQITFGEKHGIHRDRFVLDPGIGFGKTVEQNIEIIKHLSEFKKLGLPLLIGVSRKSHLGIILKDELKIETEPTARLEASLAETAIAVQQGAGIVRTHDIMQTKKFLAVLEKFS